MKAYGEKPQYFDGGPGMNFPLAVPPLLFWVCSVCGEVAATSSPSASVIPIPPKWDKVRLTEDECKKRNIPFYPNDSDQKVLLLCTDCQEEEKDEKKTEDASSD